MVFTIFDGEAINLQIFPFSALICVYQRLTKLKKQSQFISYCVLRDVYCVRDLKKQSQFATPQSDVRLYLKGGYGKVLLCGAQKNKAKQSQFT